MKRLLMLSLPLAALLLLGGCRLQSLEIVPYRARGVVQIPETREPMTVSPTAQAIQAAVPWQPLLDMLKSVLPWIGQTRRHAMDEKVNYIEEREFLRLTIRMKDCPDEEKP